MKKFIKDNITIVLAITLPLVLVGIFMISSLFTKITVADPVHDFLIATEAYNNENTAFTFNILDDRLVITYNPPLEKDKNGYRPEQQIPKLWRINVPEMSVEEIELIEPDDKKSSEISITGITDIKIQNIHPSPDGYEFLDNFYRGGNLMTELFADSRNYGSNSAITKQGRILKFKLPDGGNFGSYNTSFIGWIIEQP